MYHTLRQGGHFVCKLFDVTLSGTAQLIAFLCHSFERVAIIKPITSRPASSERYIVSTYRSGQSVFVGADVINGLTSLLDMHGEKGPGGREGGEC